MKKQDYDSIDFPANPFVALADYLMLLVSILILAILYQNVSNGRVIERMAIKELQNMILSEVSNGQTSDGTDLPILKEAYRNGQIRQTHIDGDLQRFWFDSRLFDSKDSGNRVLTEFGKVLKPYEGNLNDPGSGLYKRIIVEGHTDRSDGDDAQVWSTSSTKALSAISILQREAKLSPRLLEPSARGCFVAPDDNVGSGTYAQRSRRLEVVIVYSGNRALHYLEVIRITRRRLP